MYLLLKFENLACVGAGGWQLIGRADNASVAFRTCAGREDNAAAPAVAAIFVQHLVRAARGVY